MVCTFSRGSRQRYGRLNEYDAEPYLDNEIQDGGGDDDDDENVPGESPVVRASADNDLR